MRERAAANAQILWGVFSSKGPSLRLEMNVSVAAKHRSVDLSKNLATKCLNYC